MKSVRTRMVSRGRLLLASVTATVISGCWSGKHYEVGPFSYGTDSTGLRTAIATPYEVTQTADGSPIQLDGPAKRTDAFGILVWVCDASARQLHALGLLALPDSLAAIATLPPLTVADWAADQFIVYMPGPQTTLQVSASGEFSTLPPSASDTVHASQVIAPYCTTQLDSLRSVPVSGLSLNAGK